MNEHVNLSYANRKHISLLFTVNVLINKYIGLAIMQENKILDT